MDFRNGRKKNEVLELIKPGTELCVFDTETTGLHPETTDRIIEFSAMKWRVKEDYSLEKLDQFQQYIKPPFVVTQEITDLTGISNEFLADKPSEEVVAFDIYKYLHSTPICLGHNVPFDIRFVKGLCERNGLEYPITASLDTLTLAKDLIKKEDVENFKLGTLLGVLGLDEGIQFHSAIDDVYATSLLLQALLQAYAAQGEEEVVIEKLTVLGVAFWQKYDLKRIYINTNKGSVFFQTEDYVGSKTVDVTRVDMDALKKDAMEFIGVNTMEEFLAFRGQKGQVR